MAALFMDYSVALRATDVQWGWTALHCAAHVGMVKVVEKLLGKRASPYAESKVEYFPASWHFFVFGDTVTLARATGRNKLEATDGLAGKRKG